MNLVYEKLLRTYESVKSKVPFKPQLALILGSGLGDFADAYDIEAEISYHDIVDFPVSTVPGHKGRFVFTHVEGVPCVIMQGRVHLYEGYGVTDVVLPTRLMHLMGAEVLFLTNASGGINYSFKAGDFMLIRDQITTFVPNPLRGANIDELGLRFPDMSKVYDEGLRDKIKEAARLCNIDLKEGVYIQMPGPAFETPAEVRMARILGADATGMSTTVEATTAIHLGMKVCGISCITNLAAGINPNPLSHIEVNETADRVAPLFKKLVASSIKAIGK